jgi:hypothetical protein
VHQWVPVNPNTTYVATGFIRTSEGVGTGYFSVRDDEIHGGGVINEVSFQTMTGPYRKLEFEFDSGPNTRVLLYAGFFARVSECMGPPGAVGQIAGAECKLLLFGPQWIQVDDLAIVETDG